MDVPSRKQAIHILKSSHEHTAECDGIPNSCLDWNPLFTLKRGVRSYHYSRIRAYTPATKPMMWTQPESLTALLDFWIVFGPPTSMTWSTPLPPVCKEGTLDYLLISRKSKVRRTIFLTSSSQLGVFL